jgi:CBS-domain-containing membrane protein
VIVLEDVQRVPAASRASVRVEEVVRRVPSVDAADEASRALRAFAEAGAQVVPVLDGGALYGMLTATDVVRGLQLGELEETQHPHDRGPLRRRLIRAEQHF